MVCVESRSCEHVGGYSPEEASHHVSGARKEDRMGILGILKGLEVPKTMGPLGNTKRLSVAGAQGAW